MQLPRGTFHSIKKHVLLDNLLTDVTTAQFTGSILFSSSEGATFLVLQKGTIILAEHKGLGGIAAVQQIQQMGRQEVDAELANLNETQLALAEEFNKSYDVRKVSGPSILFGKKENTVVKTSPSKTIPVATPSEPLQRNLGKGEIEKLLSGDLEVLDQMDLDKMSGKFRLNAEHIAKELNLDHLAGEP
ncbi:MAG: hypothetical protein LUP99_05020 [Methanomicrobiales archaeon]|nr:hypothetical protein [Methanomicrobiales archaeon]